MESNMSSHTDPISYTPKQPIQQQPAMQVHDTTRPSNNPATMSADSTTSAPSLRQKDGGHASGCLLPPLAREDIAAHCTCRMRNPLAPEQGVRATQFQRHGFPEDVTMLEYARFHVAHLARHIDAAIQRMQQARRAGHHPSGDDEWVVNEAGSLMTRVMPRFSGSSDGFHLDEGKLFIATPPPEGNAARGETGGSSQARRGLTAAANDVAERLVTTRTRKQREQREQRQHQPSSSVPGPESFFSNRALRRGHPHNPQPPTPEYQTTTQEHIPGYYVYPTGGPYGNPYPPNEYVVYGLQTGAQQPQQVQQPQKGCFISVSMSAQQQQHPQQQQQGWPAQKSLDDEGFQQQLHAQQLQSMQRQLQQHSSQALQGQQMQEHMLDQQRQYRQLLQRNQAQHHAQQPHQGSAAQRRATEADMYSLGPNTYSLGPDQQLRQPPGISDGTYWRHRDSHLEGRYEDAKEFLEELNPQGRGGGGGDYGSSTTGINEQLLQSLSARFNEDPVEATHLYREYLPPYAGYELDAGSRTPGLYSLDPLSGYQAEEAVARRERREQRREQQQQKQKQQAASTPPRPQSDDPTPSSSSGTSGLPSRPVEEEEEGWEGSYQPMASMLPRCLAPLTRDKKQRGREHEPHKGQEQNKKRQEQEHGQPPSVYFQRELSSGNATVASPCSRGPSPAPGSSVAPPPPRDEKMPARVAVGKKSPEELPEEYRRSCAQPTKSDTGREQEQEKKTQREQAGAPGERHNSLICHVGGVIAGKTDQCSLFNAQVKHQAEMHKKWADEARKKSEVTVAKTPAAPTPASASASAAAAAAKPQPSSAAAERFDRYVDAAAEQPPVRFWDYTVDGRDNIVPAKGPSSADPQAEAAPKEDDNNVSHADPTEKFTALSRAASASLKAAIDASRAGAPFVLAPPAQQVQQPQSQMERLEPQAQQPQPQAQTQPASPMSESSSWTEISAGTTTTAESSSNNTNTNAAPAAAPDAADQPMLDLKPPEWTGKNPMEIVRAIQAHHQAQGQGHSCRVVFRQRGWVPGEDDRDGPVRPESPVDFEYEYECESEGDVDDDEYEDEDMDEDEEDMDDLYHNEDEGGEGDEGVKGLD